MTITLTGLLPVLIETVQINLRTGLTNLSTTSDSTPLIAAKICAYVRAQSGVFEPTSGALNSVTATFSFVKDVPNLLVTRCVPMPADLDFNPQAVEVYGTGNVVNCEGDLLTVKCRVHVSGGKYDEILVKATIHSAQATRYVNVRRLLVPGRSLVISGRLDSIDPATKTIAISWPEIDLLGRDLAEPTSAAAPATPPKAVASGLFNFGVTPATATANAVSATKVVAGPSATGGSESVLLAEQPSTKRTRH